MTDKKTNHVSVGDVLILWTETMVSASRDAKKNSDKEDKYTAWIKKVIYFQTAIMLVQSAILLFIAVWLVMV